MKWGRRGFYLRRPYLYIQIRKVNKKIKIKEKVIKNVLTVNNYNKKTKI